MNLIAIFHQLISKQKLIIKVDNEHIWLDFLLLLLISYYENRFNFLLIQNYF